jgi:hypothetical protein
MPVARASARTTRRGSTAGHPIGDEQLRTMAVYREVAEGLLDGPIPTSGRSVAIAEDLAIFVMLLVAFGEAPNADGSMPTKRFKAVWESMYERGEVDRPWNPNRFTALRNYLTKRSMIRWIDRRHVEGFVGDDGEYVKGKAARWAAGRKLVELIERTVERGGGEEEHLSYNRDEKPPTSPPVWGGGERDDLGDDQDDPLYVAVLRLFDDSFVNELREEHFTRPLRSPELWGERRLAA